MNLLEVLGVYKWVAWQYGTFAVIFLLPALGFALYYFVRWLNAKEALRMAALAKSLARHHLQLQQKPWQPRHIFHLHAVRGYNLFLSARTHPPFVKIAYIEYISGTEKNASSRSAIVITTQPAMPKFELEGQRAWIFRSKNSEPSIKLHGYPVLAELFVLSGRDEKSIRALFGSELALELKRWPNLAIKAGGAPLLPASADGGETAQQLLFDFEEKKSTRYRNDQALPYLEAAMRITKLLAARAQSLQYGEIQNQRQRFVKSLIRLAMARGLARGSGPNALIDVKSD